MRSENGPGTRDEASACRGLEEAISKQGLKSVTHLVDGHAWIGSLFCSPLNAQQSSSPQPSATVPRLVNFSRRAVDAQAKLIAGIAGVTGVTWLAIYKDRYEGARLWLESQNIQADAKGNYTVQLGATKPEGLPLDLFSSGDVRSEHAHTENSRSPGMHLYI